MKFYLVKGHNGTEIAASVSRGYAIANAVRICACCWEALVKLGYTCTQFESTGPKDVTTGGKEGGS